MATSKKQNSKIEEDGLVTERILHKYMVIVLGGRILSSLLVKLNVKRRKEEKRKERKKLNE